MTTSWRSADDEIERRRHDDSHPALEALFAPAPDPGFADELLLFGQFVGSWELEVVYHDPNGERRLSAEWHFSWALNGRAVQDIWIAPSRRDRERGETEVDWGTTVRFYDARIEAWRSTWIGPVKGLVLPSPAVSSATRSCSKGSSRKAS